MKTNLETKRDQSLYKNRRRLEWTFCILGALNCILVSVSFTYPQFSVAGLISFWPFPLIYFIEIIFIGVICLVAIGMIKDNLRSLWSGLPWICSGLLLAFVILGAWTIGFFLLPAMILFMLAGILADRRTQGNIPLHIIFFVSAGLFQAIIVFGTLLV